MPTCSTRVRNMYEHDTGTEDESHSCHSLHLWSSDWRSGTEGHSHSFFFLLITDMIMLSLPPQKQLDTSGFVCRLNQNGCRRGNQVYKVSHVCLQLILLGKWAFLFFVIYPTLCVWERESESKKREAARSRKATSTSKSQVFSGLPFCKKEKGA